MMKNKILSMLGAGLLMLTLSACHEQSDTLLPYDHNDELSFGEAEKSYAGKFKVLWNALNQNYSLWDYERENGLDWDAVYDEYLPQFEELDKQDDVSDDDLEELLAKVVAPLHDGHMSVMVKNHATGNYVKAIPARIRNLARPDYVVSKSYHPSLEYYSNVENGEIEVDEEGNPCYMEYSSSVEKLMEYFTETQGIGLQWIVKEIDKLQELVTPTVEQVDRLHALETLRKEIMKAETNHDVATFNALALQYGYLGVPGFNPIFADFQDFGMTIRYALLKGNVAYLYISDFSLLPYLSEEYHKDYFAKANSQALEQAEKLKNVWEHWFDDIQQLHKNGKLGGVIIDVRGNGGGFMHDFQYVMGALLPSGGFSFYQMRFKRGTGRLDYSPLMPMVMPTMKEAHETITEPIAVLANCGSVSMSEMTSLSTKYIDNARLIGKRTWGGLCALSGNESFSYNYVTHIGVEDVTPVYVYLPMVASFTHEGKILEGIGITPDIEVDLDVEQFKLTGKDSQLDRALEYIRTGK